MKKFFVLLKKEIQELLTLQMLGPLIAVVLIFFFIGKVVGNEAAKSQTTQAIQILDLDNTATSGNVIAILKQNKINPIVITGGNINDVINNAKLRGEKAVLIIPAGFETAINNLSPQKIEVYSIMKNFSMTSSIKEGSLRTALSMANESISNQLLIKSSSKTNPIALKQPIQTNDFVIIGDRQANVNPAAVASFISSQTTFIPIILFLVIVMASQLIVVSISSEKENKTLETLLSTPVNRQYIVASKLLSAGIVALLSASIYLLGMRNYMSGLTSSIEGPESAADAATNAAMIQLGLVFTVPDYLLLGLSLFFGILAALSVAIVLGAFAEDTKSAQGVITPLMVMILIPYFLTLFLDINSLSPVVRWLVYAIPFAHIFLTAPNILLGNYANIWFGILYLAIFFIVFVYIASRIFAFDKIFTLKIGFPKK